MKRVRNRIFSFFFVGECAENISRHAWLRKEGSRIFHPTISTWWVKEQPARHFTTTKAHLTGRNRADPYLSVYRKDATVSVSVYAKICIYIGKSR